MAKKQLKDTEKKSQTTIKLWSWRVVGPVIIAAVLLLIANSALWVNNVLFNTQEFTTLTSQALLSESSRNAIAAEVVDTVLEDRPVVKRVIGEPATKLIAGLLGTNLTKSATDKLVATLQTAVTTKNPRTIEFDLTGIKSTATKLIELTGEDSPIPEGRELPDTLVVLDANRVPNFYGYGVVFLWLAPISALIAIILLAYPHIKQKRFIMSLSALQGAALVLTGFMALLVGPLFRPPVLAQISSSNLRVVVENIYNTFIATFNSQSSWLFVAGGMLLLIPASMVVYSQLVAPRLSKKK